RGTFAQQIATWESARQEGKSLGEHMLDVTRADRYPTATGVPVEGAPPLTRGDRGPRGDGDAPTSPGGRTRGTAVARARWRRAAAGATALVAILTAGGLQLARSRHAGPAG